MCLRKSTVFPKIAAEPIIVYKYMKYYQDDWVQSPLLLGPLYEIGDTMKSSVSPLFGIFTRLIGMEGVHSIDDSSGNDSEFFRRSGFDDLCLVECEIPKGSLYYESCGLQTKHFASGRIKLLKILTLYPGLQSSPQTINNKNKKQRNIKKIKHGHKRRKI